jgi:hypothetical protein
MKIQQTALFARQVKKKKAGFKLELDKQIKLLVKNPQEKRRT